MNRSAAIPVAPAGSSGELLRIPCLVCAGMKNGFGRIKEKKTADGEETDHICITGKVIPARVWFFCLTEEAYIPARGKKSAETMIFARIYLRIKKRLDSWGGIVYYGMQSAAASLSRCAGSRDVFQDDHAAKNERIRRHMTC